MGKSGKKKDFCRRMNPRLYFPLTLLVFVLAGAASGQQGWPQRHSISAAAHLPVGTFSSTHVAGAGADYTWSHSKELLPGAVGFAAGGGMDYFLGKKEKAAGYDYRNGNYFSLYGLAGAVYRPGINYHLSVMAGPSLGIYKGSASAGGAFRFASAYRWNEQWAIGPAVFLRQHINTKALWTVSLRASRFL